MESEHDQNYLGLIRRIITGDTVTLPEFLAHIDHQNQGAAPGLPVGATMPAFALPDQAGAFRSLSSLTNAAGLLMVFVRTVNWCGYCRNQLAELNESVNTLREQGIAVVGIAPDEPALVAEFARFSGLEFPLLTDEGAQFAEQIGILNPGIPTGSVTQNSGRIPFPGHYLVDPAGVIVAAEFTDDLRHRISATTLAFEHGAQTGRGPAVTLEASEVTLRLEFSSLHVHTGQEISYAATLDIAPGWHLYGPGAGAAYQPLELLFDGPLVGAHRIAFPPAVTMLQPGESETVPTYAGQIEGRGRIRLTWSPPVHGSRHVAGLADVLKARQTAPGDYVLTGTLTYQACGENTCMPPVRRAIEVPITILADIGKVAPVFSAEL